MTNGWDAIDARLAEIYPGVEPKHFGTLHRFALGGPDPLDGVSFYPRDDHWHVVTYGMSELYEKETADPELSGWGFEFTFRIARAATDEEPPIWAANLLQNLARYVYSSGNWFESGHHMNANGPLRQGYETAMTALAFTTDAELGTIATPNGRVEFLQVVGLTGDEYDAARHWHTDKLLALLSASNRLLITDLDRPSATGDPAVREAVEAGRARDGSSTGVLFLGGFACVVSGDAIQLTIKAVTAAGVASAVRDRLPHGLPLVLEGDSARVALLPAETFALRQPDEGPVELDLPAVAVDALIGLGALGSQVLPATDGRVTAGVV